ncbi:MAG: hypothetical protein FWC67_01150 [Defluviitaleaceae bacterium]|nr:hypothetical protein [Defluviitaleaceae bacterium]
MRVYLDVCAYSRLFDDLSQERIRLEAEVITTILQLCKDGLWTLVGSDVINSEIGKIKDLDKRKKAIEYCGLAKIDCATSDKTIKRAIHLQDIGFGVFDSMHIALAEEARVDALITTDDKMISLAGRANLCLKVINPLKWVKEVLK